MRVHDVFTRDAAVCTPRTSLQQVIEAMLEHNCGFLPVVEPEDGSLVGVITDRDACIALAAHRRTASHVSAGEAMTHPVFSCLEDDDVLAALKTMRERRVRRLPVVNNAGRLQGALSLDDIVVHAVDAEEPLLDDIAETLRALCARKPAKIARD